MRLEELRSRVARRVGFKSTSPDQDFDGGANDQWKYIDWAINESIKNEYNEAVDECGTDPFERTVTDTWASSSVTYTLPFGLTADQLVAIYDVTDSVRGEPLWMGDRTGSARLVWRDGETLEWGSAGPGRSTSLRIQYFAEPKELTEATQEPELFPRRFHHLFVWGACCILRDEADEMVPGGWLKQRDAIRGSLHKQLSSLRPRVTGPRPANNMAE